mmetsp:Transcript_29275/g.41211  ORF Transcript_29275/g.41211 Transcript_29275/m.41211 type:complete len:216 (+) Transcript_29275:68-715(+)
MASKQLTIAVIPGTGRMGYGFSHRFAKAGHKILLGSRDTTKAQEAADKILKEVPHANIQAGKTEELPLSSADLIVWCLQGSIKESIAYLKTFDFKGKIILDCTNIVYKVPDPNTILGKTSATEMNAEAYPSAKWVSGFKVVAAAELLNDKPAQPAFLYSDDKEALEFVKNLVLSVNVDVAKTGTLVEARESEAALWEYCKTAFPNYDKLYLNFQN